MADELTRRLMGSKNYCIIRLAELKENLDRLHNESVELKSRLEDGVGEFEAGKMRGLRKYMARRIEELKAERTKLTAELHTTTEALDARATSL